MNQLLIKKFFFYSLASLIIFTSCKAANAAPSASKKNEWSYSGATGPANWGNLSPDYSLCSTGLEQSPVDINNPVALAASAFSISYQPTAVFVNNDTHNVYYRFPENSNNTLTLDFDSYDLENLHFHIPAEHTLKGKRYDMEAHLTHSNKNGDHITVGILLEKGANNLFLDQLFKIPFSTQSAASQMLVDVSGLYTQDLTYYNYMGSLTYPPCPEDINWIVLTHVGTVSAAQIEKFQHFVTKFNSRPTQPLNGRTVMAISKEQALS